jgi:hypothetical protein
LDNDSLNQSPIWNRLTFVKTGYNYWVGGNVWLFGGTLSAEEPVKTVLTTMNAPFPETALETYT